MGRHRHDAMGGRVMTNEDRIREYDPRQRFRLYRTTPDGDLEHEVDVRTGIGGVLVLNELRDPDREHALRRCGQMRAALDELAVGCQVRI